MCHVYVTCLVSFVCACIRVCVCDKMIYKWRIHMATSLVIRALAVINRHVCVHVLRRKVVKKEAQHLDPRWWEWAVSPTLYWPWAPETLRAAFSVHSCTPWSCMTVQPHTAPTQSLSLQTTPPSRMSPPTIMRGNMVPGQQPPFLMVCKAEDMIVNFRKRQGRGAVKRKVCVR